MGKYIQQKGKNFQVSTPVSDLEWVIVSGKGKENTFNGNMEFSATLVLKEDSDEWQEFKAEMDAFWKENKPAKAKKPASTSTYIHKVDSGKVDDDGDKIYDEDGCISIQMKTRTEWADGKSKKITIFNAKGNEVSLGDKMIGNGSRGKLIGVITTYDNSGKQGMSMYLNAVQLSKFVEYSGSIEAEAIDEEDGFEGFDEELPESEEATSSESGGQPRL